VVRVPRQRARTGVRPGTGIVSHGPRTRDLGVREGTVSINIGTYVIGEIPPPFTYQFLDSSGAPIDLTNYTAQFACQEFYGAPFTGTASVSDAVNGKATYVWAGGEFSTAGQYRATFTVGDHTNRFTSESIVFTAQLPVGAVPSI
jgi:hypothetical protein